MRCTKCFCEYLTNARGCIFCGWTGKSSTDHLNIAREVHTKLLDKVTDKLLTHYTKGE